MIALDTNVLARFYIDDAGDLEAQKQSGAARHVFETSDALFVPVTVVLELEWVARALYEFAAHDFSRMIEHLVGLPNVTLEDWPAVLDALAWYEQGLDFADALHLARSSGCDSFLTFDDRHFARRAARIGATPPVSVPSRVRA
jgi:predicted nucleic-acid-binding protein